MITFLTLASGGSFLFCCYRAKKDNDISKSLAESDKYKEIYITSLDKDILAVDLNYFKLEREITGTNIGFSRTFHVSNFNGNIEDKYFLNKQIRYPSELKDVLLVDKPSEIISYPASSYHSHFVPKVNEILNTPFFSLGFFGEGNYNIEKYNLKKGENVLKNGDKILAIGSNKINMIQSYFKVYEFGFAAILFGGLTACLIYYRMKQRDKK